MLYCSSSDRLEVFIIEALRCDEKRKKQIDAGKIILYLELYKEERTI